MEQKRLLIHAPNVHTGGGLILIRELVSSNSFPISWAQIDERTKNSLQLPKSITQYYVRRSVFSRLLAEWRLLRNVSANDVVLCFHGLPPLFSLPGRVVVFIQNRILIERVRLAGYPLQTKVRLLVERFWLRTMQNHSSRYIVQTPSMATSLKRSLGNNIETVVLPFAASRTLSPKVGDQNQKERFDFLYVASGDAHKNHVMLLEAWRLLAEAGLKPSLGLTVDPLSYPGVADEILRISRESSLNINNLGQLSAEKVAGLYQSSLALIYPSKTESLGLPLIEAMEYGLPILASELDYVRDVVVPAETFNPDSPVSIARAVRRFLGNAELTIRLHSAEAFLAEVLR